MHLLQTQESSRLFEQLDFKVAALVRVYEYKITKLDNKVSHKCLRRLFGTRT